MEVIVSAWHTYRAYVLAWLHEPPRVAFARVHERGMLGQPDLLVTLREEILAVVSRHVQLDPDRVTV
jgi:hypothetical protein